MRCAQLVGASTLLLAFTAPTATASDLQPAPPAAQELSVESAHALSAELADVSQGTYYDAGRRRLVVDVLDASAADAVRARGAEPRLVDNSLEDLQTATSTLKSEATVPGTAWSIDPELNRVVVIADPTVDDVELAKVRKSVDGLGQRAELRFSDTPFTLTISGGDAIWGPTVGCSLGFNVVKGGQPYFLTAGHCGNAARTWSATQTGPQLGTTEKSSFPGNDYALVKYTADAAHPSAVNLYDGSSRAITAAGDALVGQSVTRSGMRTHVHTGVVRGLNATVNYQEGSVEGLIRTTVCAEPGDSGGPLFDGSTALGLTSGGNGNCTSGGETYFQPVPEALQVFGAQIG